MRTSNANIRLEFRASRAENYRRMEVVYDDCERGESRSQDSPRRLPDGTSVACTDFGSLVQLHSNSGKGSQPYALRNIAERDALTSLQYRTSTKYQSLRMSRFFILHFIVHICFSVSIPVLSYHHAFFI
jgi:hypothetical protein